MIINNRQKLSELITTGNTTNNSLDNSRGWFIGHFIGAELGLRHTKDVEVKWGEHLAGERKTLPTLCENATTLTILLKGKFVIEFSDIKCSVILDMLGDYVIFAPKVAHSWEALEDSTVLTVRWPSILPEE